MEGSMIKRYRWKPIDLVLWWRKQIKSALENKKRKRREIRKKQKAPVDARTLKKEFYKIRI